MTVTYMSHVKGIVPLLFLSHFLLAEGHD